MDNGADFKIKLESICQIIAARIIEHDIKENIWIMDLEIGHLKGQGRIGIGMGTVKPIACEFSMIAKTSMAFSSVCPSLRAPETKSSSI